MNLKDNEDDVLVFVFAMIGEIYKIGHNTFAFFKFDLPIFFQLKLAKHQVWEPNYHYHSHHFLSPNPLPLAEIPYTSSVV